MSVLVCKMCGAPIRPVDKSLVCTCEYCGNTQTILDVENENELRLFKRAQELLQGCNFDTAYDVYREISEKNPKSAEAYWGQLLSRCGIEYVEDPATGRKMPTCHRLFFEDLFQSEEYLKIRDNATEETRDVYSDQLALINETVKISAAESSKIEPYDVFISYKESDENGNRTEDSVIAQTIYEKLTAKGYRVFFSRISLAGMLGSHYEAVIFAALRTSKVMIAIATSPEYYDSVWVKNEWGRFIKLKSKGEKRTLIPCYKNMDIQSLPQELRLLPSIDLSESGAVNDLIRGIEKIIPINNQINEKNVTRKLSKKAIIGIIIVAAAILIIIILLTVREKKKYGYLAAADTFVPQSYIYYANET